jgi:lipopolysaccharide export system permease protein
VAIRSFGQNIWQTLLPVILAAGLVGLAYIFVFNPIAAVISQQHDSQMNSIFKNQKNNLVSISSSGIWLRDTIFNDNVYINGSNMNTERAIIFNPIIYVLSESGGLKSLIKAKSMRLNNGFWVFDNPSRTRQDGQVEVLKNFKPSSTLDRSIMLNAGRPLRTISLYELSDYIDTLQTAGIPVEKLRVQFHKTLALPLQLIGLALLAASFTLLTFSRQRRIRIIIMGLGAGFLYYFVSDLIFLLGHNSRLPDFVAGWLPAILIFTISGFLLARGDEH